MPAEHTLARFMLARHACLRTKHHHGHNMKNYIMSTPLDLSQTSPSCMTRGEVRLHQETKSNLLGQAPANVWKDGAKRNRALPDFLSQPCSL